MAPTSPYLPTGSTQHTTPQCIANRKPTTRQISNTKLADISSTLFVHLPPYSPPQTPLFRILPGTLIPYAELMRLHKPAGYFAFFFPHLVGTLLAASRGPITPSLQTLIRIIFTHAVANLFLRGSACAYNDALDGSVDRLVERCRHQPVARGAVSPFASHVFAAAQALIWVAILTTLPSETVKPAILIALTMLLYPWCKGFTNYPQVVLGFSLAAGQGIGIGVMEWDVQKEQDFWKLVGMTTLYLSAVLNAIIYDIVYAHQDLQDDLKAGVKSMAIACRGWTKQWLSLLSVLEILLLASTGYAVGFQGAYWLVSLSDPICCGRWPTYSWQRGYICLKNIMVACIEKILQTEACHEMRLLHAAY